MRSIVGRLVIWLAEILDRNLITVPEIDEHWSPVHSQAPVR
jgi:hypothetical protein